MSRGCPTLISQQAVCDIVSPQSGCTAQESLLTKVHRGKKIDEVLMKSFVLALNEGRKGERRRGHRFLA